MLVDKSARIVTFKRIIETHRTIGGVQGARALKHEFIEAQYAIR